MTQNTDETTVLLLASQPILDRHEVIRGFELLYRSDTGLSALDVGESVATSEVVYNLSTAITQRCDLLEAPAFINVSSDLLLTPHFLPLPPEQVVIELVERITPTPKLIEAVHRLHRQGFRFALDDFEFTPDWEPLLEVASYIKVDISTVTLEEVQAYRERFGHLNVCWVAERIETREDYDAYRAQGFDFFQGYFFTRPIPVYGKKIEPSTLQAAQLLSHLTQSDPDTARIIALIEADPKLAIKLTRIANSAQYRHYGTIESIKGVVARLGLQQLASWIMLFGLLGHAHSQYALLVLTRAQFCEQLARQQALSGQAAYFIGILSAAELLIGIPNDEFMESLTIDAVTREAVIGHQGSYGEILSHAEEAERLNALHQTASTPAEQQRLTLYQQAHNAAFELLGALSGSAATA